MSLFFMFLLLSTVSLGVGLPGAQAQETDIFQHPNYEQVGIKKSLEQQIGADRGDINTPDSSLYIISRDPFRSIRRGRNLFQRKFTISQGMGPRNGDGLGDISADNSLGAGLKEVVRPATGVHVGRRDLVETCLPARIAGMPHICSG